MAIVGVASAVGVGALWAAWALWSPVVGVDGVYYHLPQMLRWFHDGAPGSVDRINYIYEVGSYPLTNAVAQTWGLGISKSMVTISIWPMLNMSVLCLAGWVGLRRFSISPGVRVLAILAVVTTPVALIQLAGPLNDLPALSWLACGAALVVCSRANPRLLVPAAGRDRPGDRNQDDRASAGRCDPARGKGLLHRKNLRQMRGVLAVGFAVFFVVGAFWYVRTFVEHGSPFWPWAAAPWGDPVPPFLQNHQLFLSALGETLAGRLDLYASFMAGAVVILSSALTLALFKGDRTLRWLGALLAGLLLLWASAPSTAIAPIFDGSVSQTRYLVPAIGLAAVVTALASRGTRRFEPAASLARY